MTKVAPTWLDGIPAAGNKKAKWKMAMLDEAKQEGVSTPLIAEISGLMVVRGRHGPRFQRGLSGPIEIAPPKAHESELRKSAQMRSIGPVQNSRFQTRAQTGPA